MSDILPTEASEAKSDDKDEIVEVAEATLAQIPPPEIEPYNISFSSYKKDKCSVNGIDGANAQVAIRIVRDIGLHFKDQDNFSRQTDSRLQIIPIANSGDYTDYYKGLPEEIQDLNEVKELKYVDTRPDKEANLRIFYYTLSSVFYMLAITANRHENLDHKPYKFKGKKRRY